MTLTVASTSTSTSKNLQVSKRKVRMKKALVRMEQVQRYQKCSRLTAFKFNGHGSRISFTRYFNHFFIYLYFYLSLLIYLYFIYLYFYLSLLFYHFFKNFFYLFLKLDSNGNKSYMTFL